MKQTETLIRLIQNALKGSWSYKTARARRFVGRRQPREKASANAQGVRLP